MYKRRLIPVLFLKDGWIVRSENFSIYQVIGDPVHHVRRMVDWDVDELIIINIGNNNMEHHRADCNNKPVNNSMDLLNIVSVECNIPLAFGGGIRSINDIASIIRNGADKVILNTVLLNNTSVVSEAVSMFGSQAIVASIDYRVINNKPWVFSSSKQKREGVELNLLVNKAIDLGVGEIFLNCIDRDGSASGYDIYNIKNISNNVDIPIIVCGGAGLNSHFLECFKNTDNNVALAAGNFFHFKEHAYPNVKNYLYRTIKNIRYTELGVL